MDEQIRQIAERLRGLRDAMELSTAEVARDCGIDPASTTSPSACSSR